MAKNPRLNVTFEEKTVLLLTALAKEEKKSLSKIINELVINSLSLKI